MFDNLITLSQYARLHGLNSNTVETWAKRGQLPLVVIAGRRFVARSARPQHNTRAQGVGQ